MSKNKEVAKKVKKTPIIYIKDRPFLYWFRQMNLIDVAVMVSVMLIGSGIYFYLLTKSIAYTTILIIPPALLNVYLMTMKKKGDVIKKNATECMRYINNVVFHLDSHNIAQSLELCLESVNGEFKEDLQEVINKLNKTGELDLDVFKKYDLPSLDQFHETLSIVYKEGTNSIERVFVPIKDFLLLELSKQDKLRNARKSFIRSVMTIQLIVLALPLALLFMTPPIYEMFLETSIYVLIIYLLFSVVTSVTHIFLNKIASDISVRN